jgi:hypothetical protein
MNAQLGTDLAKGPILAVQVGCTLNVHGRHRNDGPWHRLTSFAKLRASLLCVAIRSSTQAHLKRAVYVLFAAGATMVWVWAPPSDQESKK